MKASGILIGLLMTGCLWGQRDKKDDIVYYEDSRVRNSRFSFTLEGNPNLVNRNLINDEISSGAGLDLPDGTSEGTFAFNYGLNVFYDLGSALALGTGLHRIQAGYSFPVADLYSSEVLGFDFPDTVRVSGQTDVTMIGIPLLINFHTPMSDIFDLEVQPAIHFVFTDLYRTEFTSGQERFTHDFSDLTRSLNTRVGLGLGGTWYFADNWGFLLRFNANYILNPLIELEGYPRENLFSFGLQSGLKWKL